MGSITVFSFRTEKVFILNEHKYLQVYLEKETTVKWVKEYWKGTKDIASWKNWITLW